MFLVKNYFTYYLLLYTPVSGGKLEILGAL